jgi:hypothetical protein
MLKEIDIRAVCPSLTLDCFQLGACRSKVQSHRQLANLMMLESVERGHHEVYQPTIAVARGTSRAKAKPQCGHRGLL